MRYINLLALPLAFAVPLTERDEATPSIKYIVVLKGDAPKPVVHSRGNLPSKLANIQAGAAVASIEKDLVYGFGNFKGFAAKLNLAQITALKNDPQVAYVTTDDKAHAVNNQNPQDEGKFMIQTTTPSWGLARISNHQINATSYVYHSSAGTGTCAYIVDTGVDATHPEYEGRATLLKNFASEATTDDNGHGTHVAGTIGSKTYGVAKQAKLLGVKVLDDMGSGDWSTIITGIEYAVNDTATRGCPNGAVMNLSVGGPRNQAVNDAVAAAVVAGVFVAVAAGNDGVNVDGSSPGSEPTVFTVGATDSADNITSFSNYGALVDIFAPGMDILSTWPNSTTNTISGSSMATPHIAGLAAYLLGYYGKMTPAELGDKLNDFGTRNLVNNIFANTGTPNLLAYNGRPDEDFDSNNDEDEDDEKRSAVQ